MNRPVPAVIANWEGGMRFRGGVPGGPATLIDADGKEAPGPMMNLLLALAGCMGADVVSLMPKMQVELREYSMELSGDRAPEHPRRWTAVRITFRLGGVGLDEIKARRAIDLSIQRYCSVLHSLQPDIKLDYELILVD